MHGAARVTGISLGSAAGLTRQVKGEPSSFDFAGVCVFCQFSDPQMIVVSGLVFHVGEDATGVLPEDGVEGDQWLENSAPFELVQAPHTMENCGERRLLDWGQTACFESLLGSIQYVFQLR